MNFEFYKKLNDFNSPLGDLPEIEGGSQFFSLLCVYPEVIWRNKILWNQRTLNSKKIERFQPLVFYIILWLDWSNSVE